MRLVEQGKLELAAPVRSYLPDFAVADAAATRDIAIWHLLTHTPGCEGQLTPEDRGVYSLARFRRITEGAAAACAARRDLELQQRRLHDRRPCHRSRDRPADP